MKWNLMATFTVFIFFHAFIFSQEVKHFEIPKENEGHLSMKVNRGEVIEIGEDSAYVLSVKSFYAYRQLRNEVLNYQALATKNLEIINGSLKKYLAILNEIDHTIKQIDQLNDEQLAPIISNLADVNQKLIDDVSDLKELNKAIEEKANELKKIEKRLQRYRIKNIWFKFADWILAGAVGFAIGALAL